MESEEDKERYAGHISILPTPVSAANPQSRPAIFVEVQVMKSGRESVTQKYDTLVNIFNT
jgi:hypothetical protein